MSREHPCPLPFPHIRVPRVPHVSYVAYVVCTCKESFGKIGSKRVSNLHVWLTVKTITNRWKIFQIRATTRFLEGFRSLLCLDFYFFLPKQVNSIISKKKIVLVSNCGFTDKLFFHGSNVKLVLFSKHWRKLRMRQHGRNERMPRKKKKRRKKARNRTAIKAKSKSWEHWEQIVSLNVYLGFWIKIRPLEDDLIAFLR